MCNPPRPPRHRSGVSRVKNRVQFLDRMDNVIREVRARTEAPEASARAMESMTERGARRLTVLFLRVAGVAWSKAWRRSRLCRDEQAHLRHLRRR